MGHHAGAAAHGIKERNHIIHTDLFRLQSVADNQIAAADLRKHGIRQNDHRKYTAQGRDLVFIDIAFGYQRQIDDQNRQQYDAQNRADYGKNLLLRVAGLGCLTHRLTSS